MNKNGENRETNSENIEKQYRVLVVDDNAAFMIALAEILSDLGCEVSMAADGEQALEFAANENFDLIFLDCRMPRLTGFQVAERLREMDGPNAAVPIIGMSIDDVNYCRESCLAAGMNDFVQKSQPEQFEKSFLAWIANKPGAETPPA